MRTDPNITWTEYNGFFIFCDPSRSSIDDCGLPYDDPIHVVSGSGRSMFADTQFNNTQEAMARIDAEHDMAEDEFMKSVPRHAATVIQFPARRA